MTGPEHYREAETLLTAALSENDDTPSERYLLRAAQVHATLALAAATAYPAVSDYYERAAQTRVAYEWTRVI